jgi:GTP cyclohydrolase I
VRRFLEAFGEDGRREGLEEAPARLARMYDELLAGYRVDPQTMINEALGDVEYDQMVIVMDAEFYSLCEHHMLPFPGRARRRHPQGQGDWPLEDPACRGVVRPTSSGSGAHDAENRRVPDGGTAPAGYGGPCR